MIWRWTNVPLPEPHLAALGTATLLHAIVPLRLPLNRAGGWPLLAVGIGLAGWAVHSASATGVEIDRPNGLVTEGAYAVSRNPMYLGWSLGLAGATLISRSGWLALGTAMAVSLTDRQIVAEEHRLAGEFGDEYGRYRERVPRYLAVPLTRRR